MAIDRAVLLPGEELMERLDEEHDGPRDEKSRARMEEEDRRMQRGTPAEKTEEGQNAKQAEETKGQMDWDYAEETKAKTA